MEKVDALILLLLDRLMAVVGSDTIREVVEDTEPMLLLAEPEEDTEKDVEADPIDASTTEAEVDVEDVNTVLKGPGLVLLGVEVEPPIGPTLALKVLLVDVVVVPELVKDDREADELVSGTMLVLEEVLVGVGSPGLVLGGLGLAIELVRNEMAVESGTALELNPEEPLPELAAWNEVLDEPAPGKKAVLEELVVAKMGVATMVVELVGFEGNESVVDLEIGPVLKLEVVDAMSKVLVVVEVTLEVDLEIGAPEKLSLLTELVLEERRDVKPEAVTELGIDVEMEIGLVEELLVEFRVKVELESGRGPPEKLAVLTVVTHTLLVVDDPAPLDELLVTSRIVAAEEPLTGAVMVIEDCGRLRLAEGLVVLAVGLTDGVKTLLVAMVPEVTPVMELVV
ncbi:hypothetical protein AYO20_00376 [Fonsecaea nubica]|uniref:Uncharacterized protein n=1 Tax=Fonsecaea nubica TaxID=856822 RepID=A0A178DEL3_9EURO|nr:hypothetical protein AYO20_00376 [Fonsecaea nubica]OAL40640.1 hypothetical protein AYO20_00376 [Fonsecaea nubica]